MPSRRNSDASKVIAAAWRNAKAADPTLTQGEFAQRTLPGKVGKHGKIMPLDQKTASRELRRVIRGESNRAAEYLSAARAQQVVNVEIRDRKGRVVGYANVLLPANLSTFDIYALKDSAEADRLAKQIARAARRESPPHDVDDDEIGSPAGNPRISSIRPVRNPGKHYVGRFERPSMEQRSVQATRTHVRARAAFERAREEALPSWIDKLLG